MSAAKKRAPPPVLSQRAALTLAVSAHSPAVGAILARVSTRLRAVKSLVSAGSGVGGSLHTQWLAAAANGAKALQSLADEWIPHADSLRDLDSAGEEYEDAFGPLPSATRESESAAAHAHEQHTARVLRTLQASSHSAAVSSAQHRLQRMRDSNAELTACHQTLQSHIHQMCDRRVRRRADECTRCAIGESERSGSNVGDDVSQSGERAKRARSERGETSAAERGQTTLPAEVQLESIRRTAACLPQAAN